MGNRLKMEWERKNVCCLGGHGDKLIFYACKKSPSKTSNHNIHTQSTTSKFNPQHLHTNHNIYTQTTTSTLKPQHLF